MFIKSLGLGLGGGMPLVSILDMPSKNPNAEPALRRIRIDKAPSTRETKTLGQNRVAQLARKKALLIDAARNAMRSELPNQLPTKKNPVKTAERSSENTQTNFEN